MRLRLHPLNLIELELTKGSLTVLFSKCNRFEIFFSNEEVLARRSLYEV